MTERTVVTWNAIISCFAKQDSHQEEGLHLFAKMRCDNVRPNADTLIGALSCSGALGALFHGRSVHGIATRLLDGMSEKLGTAIIQMYCKCGCLKNARKVFEVIKIRDVSAWTAMIGGLAMHGCGEEAVGMYERMVEEQKVTPDSLVFTSVLHACSHSGLVQKGTEIFNEMKEKYKIAARMEHYGAMVDMYGRAGWLKEAKEIVKSMPFAPNQVVWGSLLHACIVHGELEFGWQLESRLSGLEMNEDEDSSGFYVGVSNVYAREGRWDEVGRVRDQMIRKSLRKDSGLSLIEVNGSFHEFYMGDGRHELTEEILGLLGGT